MKQKKFIILAIVIIIIVAFIGFSFKKTNKNYSNEPIKIVALFPLTGGLASYGEPAQKMAQIAVKDINDAGGINNRKLEIDYQDHKCDPKEATSIFQQALDVNKVKIFTSVACSGTVSAVSPLMKNDNALLLGTIITANKLSGISPYVFRNWASDKNEAKLFADEIKKRGYKKIGVIYEETDYAKGLKLSLEEFLKDSGIEIVSESFVSGSTDVRTQLSKIKQAKVEMLFISPQTVTSGDIVLKQIKELGLNKTALFVNDNIIKAKDLVSKYADVLEGAIGGDYIMKRDEKTDKILAKYREAYGVDCPQTNICSGVYDAINLLADAIKSKGYDVAGVKSYLESVDYAGISGQISFDEKHDRKNADYSLFLIKNGKAELYNQ